MKLDPQQLAAQVQFEKQSSNYGSSHKILSQLEDLKLLVQHISIRCNAPALDVATGGGHAALFLARMGCEVTASDISEGMLEMATRLAAAEGFFIHTRQHPAEELPYPAESFAIVSCRVAPHHFTDPVRFVQEAARVLMLGGFLLIIDTTVPDDSPEAAQWLDRVEKLRDPSHVRLIPPAEWLSLCRQAGLEPQFWHVTPLKQPDLEEYFRVANTSSTNRQEILRMVEEASPAVRKSYHLSKEEGKITWVWPRLGLVARKAL
jgi:ubiquinone/menaquinone biosynthesis C-methylase UbiE